ncbi:universal stress protein [Streptomyces sp. NPDC003522]
MLRTVTAGLDGSRESRAAVEWAAREARLRGLPLRIVHVRQPAPEPTSRAPLPGAGQRAERTGRVLREAVRGVRLRHPGVEVTGEQFPGQAADVLAEAAGSAELLVLGSRGPGGSGRSTVGSVGLSVVAHADRPVVLVRALEAAADEHEPDPAGIPSAATPFRPVVLGLDAGHPDETLIGFAFDAAVLRETSLRVVHGWNPPPSHAYGAPVDPALHEALALGEAETLAEALRPWRRKFPDVEVVETSRCGGAAVQVVDAAREACLVVVGRRVRRGPFGAHVGHVTHEVLHHATAPVAVVPHH